MERLAELAVADRVHRLRHRRGERMDQARVGEPVEELARVALGAIARDVERAVGDPPRDEFAIRVLLTADVPVVHGSIGPCRQGSFKTLRLSS